MNPAHISSKETLQELIDVDILITGDLNRQQEELYYNTWGMSFDRDFIKTLTIQDINDFVIELIKNRSQQVLDIDKGPATFYSTSRNTPAFKLVMKANVEPYEVNEQSELRSRVSYEEFRAILRAFKP